MLKDNDAMVNSNVILHTKIHKMRADLSFHEVSKAIAAVIVTCQFIKGMINPADILSERWSHIEVLIV